MTAIPWELFQQDFAQRGKEFTSTNNIAVGMIFLPQDQEAAQKARVTVEQVAAEEKLIVLGWRVVPVQSDSLGIQARENQPQIEQVLLASVDKSGDELERQLYITRRRISKVATNISEEFYICSLSSRTIVYKGMVRSAVLGNFYEDLKIQFTKVPLLSTIGALVRTQCPSGSSATNAAFGSQRRNQHLVGQHQLDDGTRS